MPRTRWNALFVLLIVASTIALGICGVFGLHDRDLEMAEKSRNKHPPPLQIPPSKPVPPPVPFVQPALSPEELDSVRAVALDKDLRPQQRIEALRQLRDIPSGRTPEVVRAVLGMAKGLSSQTLAAETLSLVQGALGEGDEPLVIGFMDRNWAAEVRLEAIRDLAGEEKEPAVHAVLEQAAATDPSPQVRIAAMEALKGASAPPATGGVAR